MLQTIEDYLIYMQASRGSLPATITTYRDSLTNAADYFVREKGSDVAWSTLVTDDFRAWEAEQMQRGYSPSYVKKNMAALRSMYKYLLREGRVKVDPVRLVKNPKQQKRLPTFVRENEMDRLFEYYDFGTGYQGVRNRTVVLLLYHTGIRASELTGLNVEDIDLAGCSLRVTGKGDKQRVIPFGDELHAALTTYLAARHDFERGIMAFAEEVDSDEASATAASGSSSSSSPSVSAITSAGVSSSSLSPGSSDTTAGSPLTSLPSISPLSASASSSAGALFLTQRQHRLAYNELRAIVKDALSSVTTQKRRAPHVLRHSFATAMLAHGAQLEAIQQLLGHESVATTAIYTHTTLAELKEQYAQAHPRNDEK